ncbi:MULTISPECIES: DUF938 domain-containing protein [Marinobacter]|uniref:DUF938 domain-containing protein n=1 Tax=Marinobacter TaxID=2742 RepID=UPI000DAD2146|nr:MULTISPECIES: DUF938 domain-containing protein [Marinobacter]
MTKPIAEHCLRNQQPIAEALSPYLAGGGRWLELGSGTGQHGVYIASRHAGVVWQLSDLEDAQPGLLAWQSEAALDNLPPPRILDVTRDSVPSGDFDGVFSANTVHFVGWPIVRALFDRIAEALRPGGYAALYGPFNREQRFTSEGNAALDEWLRSRDPDSGIKDEADVIECAAERGLRFHDVQDMPANNRLLVLRQCS